MPELFAPLRVTWDLPADPRAAGAQWQALVDARVLFAEVAVAPGHGGGVRGFAAALSNPGAPRLTLAAALDETRAALDVLPADASGGIGLLLLPPHAAAPSRDVLSRFREVSWAVWSTGAGLGQFAAALAAARAAGGGTLAVLNPPAPAAPLDAGQRAAAVAAWERSGAGASGAVQLRVHDLFLARDLGLEPFREYAGCQAGDALAHLAADGTVTACRTLPVPLGDLTHQGLRGIWAGAARRELRRRLSSAPAACAGCAVAGRCRGGCRGLVSGGRGPSDLEARDPSCDGPLATAEGGGR